MVSNSSTGETCSLDWPQILKSPDFWDYRNIYHVELLDKYMLYVYEHSALIDMYYHVEYK